MIFTPESAASSTLSWPADRFYWAVLEVGAAAGAEAKIPRGLCRHGVVPPGLMLDLADQVPAPIEELHAVCAPATDGGLIACAIPAEVLRSLDPAVLELSPESIPAECGRIADARALNVLVGRFEPAIRRRSRTRRQLAAMAVVAALAAALGIGMNRRASHADSLSERAGAASASILRHSLPSKPHAAQLRIELERARREAAFDPAARRSPDAAAALASALRAWPTALSTKPQSISVGPDGVSIAVVVAGDPATFLKAFEPPAGWTMDEPRLTSVDSQTRISLRLARTKTVGGHP